MSVGVRNTTAVRQCRLLRPELQIWENCLLHSYSTTHTLFVCVYVQAATKKQKYEKISERKLSTPIEILCKVYTYTYDAWEPTVQFKSTEWGQGECTYGFDD